MIKLLRQPRRAWLGRRSILAVMVVLLAILLNVSLTGATPRSQPIVALGPVSGTNCSAGCDLWAETGMLLGLPGAPVAGVPIYGYNTLNAAVTAPGGPTLIVTEGTAVSITLHNANVPSATALMIAGQPMIPDTTGVPSGNSKTYTFPASGPTALKAGTYLYEAGLTSDGPRQVAMGLYGALIVRPAGALTQAYADASTTFNDEAMLVLSEIDPAFNAAPATYDLGTYAPKYWLINGKAYPSTDPIVTAAGNKLLLRYVNAGLRHHSMGLLGLHQTIIATNGQPVMAANRSKVVAQTIPDGTTLDTMVTMPATAASGAKYALFEQAMHTDNAGVSTGGVINFGGMLTFVQVGAGSSTGSGGPITTAVTLTPSTSDGSAPVALSATITASTGANVTAAEYFIDTIGANGSGTAMAGTFGAPTASVNASITTAQLATLSSGNHTFYVHGQDSSSTGTWGAVASAVLTLNKPLPVTSAVSLTPNPSNGSVAVALTASISTTPNAAEYFVDTIGANGSGCAITGSFTSVSVAISVTGGTAPCVNLTTLSSANHTFYVHGHNANGWGAVASAVFNLDKAGPAISNTGLTPNLTNGTSDVQLQTTASDVATGNQNVTAAEYKIDSSTATAIPIALPATSVSLNATILAATVNGLSQGNHTISIRAQDALGNWGQFGTVTLTVDKTGPGISGVSTTPNPTNGTSGVQITSGGGFYQRINATITDAASNVVAAEYFIDSVGANGSGGAMFSTSGTYNGTTVTAYGAAELFGIAALSEGTHTIYVHGKDAAGNWGPTSTTTLVIDKTPPTASSVTRVGATPTNAASVQFLITFSENVIGLTSSNFTIVTGGGLSGASIASLTNNNNNTWTVTVNTGTGNGTLGLNLTSATGITDQANNALRLLSAITGQTYTIDKTAPTFTGITLTPSSITQGTASITMAVTNANDTGGSGLAGGEYWINPPTATTPTPGNGTSFTGTPASITTSSFAAGTYTISVRLKDAVGNWSTIRTAILTVTPATLATHPTVSKAFAGAVRGGNGTQAQRTTTLTITLFNSNAAAISGVGVTDNLPQPTAGTFTVVASATTCGGTTSTANTNRRLLLTGGTIPANSSCTVTATVRLSGTATNGPYTLINTIAVGGVTSTNAGSNQAAASTTLTVNP